MKIALVTNIPVPYRIPVFQKISKKFGNQFVVIYAAGREPNRLWELDITRFKYIFLKENVHSKKDGFNFVHNNYDVWGHLLSIRPDIVITTGFNPTHLYAWMYAMVFKKNHICMTDSWIESEKSLSLMHKIVRKIVFKSSSAFIGAGENSLGLYKSYGIHKNKLFKSCLCIDNNRFTNSRSFYDREYDLIFSGHLAEHKLPLFFADVVENVSKKIPNIRVLIIGDGPLKNELFSKLDVAGIDYYYAGFVPQGELPKYYANTKLLLFTTKMDAWGVIINEAMASGTPVLSTPYTGAKNDLIIDGESGFILDLDADIWSDKITELICNPGLWKKTSLNAKKSVRSFNFSNSANGIIEACEYVYEKKT